MAPHSETDGTASVQETEVAPEAVTASGPESEAVPVVKPEAALEVHTKDTKANGTNGTHINGNASSSTSEDYFKIPATCKAGIVHNPGPDFTISIEDVPVPEPGPDDLLLRLNTTGVCYSDLHYMLEDLPMPTMRQFNVRSPGHEGAGVVVKLGSNVNKNGKNIMQGKEWKVGDRAGVKPMKDVCFACEHCWGLRETYCEGAVACGLMSTGTYQQYILAPARYTTRIPDGVDDETAGPIMCSGSTIYRSLVESELRPGDWAVFPGAGGGVGHMGVQLAKAMGLRPIGVDGGEEKRELSMKLGCETFVDFTTTKDVAAEVVKSTGGKGAHGVFVTAGSRAAYEGAPAMCRTGGRVMCIGLPPAGTTTAGADPAVFVLKNLHIIGTMVGSMLDTQKALEFAERGQLKPMYEKFPISQLPDAVEKLRRGKVAGRCIVDFNA